MKSTWLDIKKTIQAAPKDPGVYIFYADKTPIYVGKAANLRGRLKSYLKITDYKTEALQNESTSLEPIVLRSDIEALIEESRLIKELKPKYNVLQRDDKSYSYVYFTKDVFPKILIGHQKPKPYTLTAKRYSRIGPFTDSGSLRTALNTIRRYFPYCTCMHSHLRDCLNAQIGKCLGFCCLATRDPAKRDKKTDPAVIASEAKQSYKNLGKIVPILSESRTLDRVTIGATSATKVGTRDDKKAEYAKNIRKIKAILRGQSQKLLKTLKNENEKMALEKIFEHKPYLVANGQSGLAKRVIRKNENQNSLLANRYTLNPTRVECFDNSHLTGKEAVGALTALVKVNGTWQSDKNSYRKFKIRSADTQDDPRMMAEVVGRRLRHPEWPYPELMIIDGGITQYRAAKSVFEKLKNEFPEIQKIKLISMAKPQKLVYGLAENDLPTSIEKLDKELRQVIEHAIYQTHHFVIRYHRNVRNKAFLGK
ncbi:MAG: excinuclease ABC subunit C [Parcubacteria group bacterium Gr01-1014_3]|nr:MAG: excinuclease ABC subunit C [Parcubacteria group bacterium Gr01-1014_3]